MSSLIVEVVKIDDILPHPNAERLELAKIKGWQCVVGKGSFKAGDTAVYLPIDSVLPWQLETKLFPPDSKVKLSRSRVRTIKLRGAISQGLLITMDDAGFPGPAQPGYGADVREMLGITKYEPPQSLGPQSNIQGRRKYQVNPHFHKYTDIENYKNYPGMFEDGETIVATEKIHGTNFRAGWVKTAATTLWKKVKRLLGFLPEWEFVFGSHNVQLQDKVCYKGWHKTGVVGKSVYSEAVEQYGLRDLLQPGEVLYGEIYGDGVQANYLYGCKPGERKMVAFDLMRNDEYVPYRVLDIWCRSHGIKMVPTVYIGPFTEEKVKELSQGPSVLDSSQKVREGVVIKPPYEEQTHAGRKVLKVINDEYLLKDQTEFH